MISIKKFFLCSCLSISILVSAISHNVPILDEFADSIDKRTIKVYKPIENFYIRTERKQSNGHEFDVIGFRKFQDQFNGSKNGDRIFVRRDTGRRHNESLGLDNLISLAFVLDDEHEGYGRAYIPSALNAMPFSVYINDEKVALHKALYDDNSPDGDLAFVLQKSY